MCCSARIHIFSCQTAVRLSEACSPDGAQRNPGLAALPRCPRIALRSMRATRNCIESKENRPLFAALGQGVARIPVFSLPPQGEGLARRQGAWPGLLQTGPRVRGSRAGPDRRALGVKRHAPRLAARQRGIFAFVPLTVVGPGRLLVAGEAARARPGDDGCVLRRPQVPLPLPANKTPPEGAPVEWIGMGST